MGEGQTFLSEEVKTSKGYKRHLMIVVAEKSGDYLLLPVTTWYNDHTKQDTTCILNESAHPFIKHKSWIDFSKATSRTAIEVFNGINKRYFISMDDLRKDVLERIQDATKNAYHLPERYLSYFDSNKD